MDVLEYSERPWGSYTVLDQGPAYKVKRIVVAPGMRLSYQMHQRRSEHWFVIAGHGMVTVDGVETDVTAGATIDVATGVAHRIENVGQDELTFIEVQRGEYFGEDDIIRIEDDFGRVATRRTA